MRVLHHYKNFAEAARDLGVSREAVRKWERDGVPAERVLFLCEKTGWSVTPNQYRPDLYPNKSDALPSEHINADT